MATVTASSRAAAKGHHPPNAEIHPSQRPSGEKGLFRYAPEALLSRNTQEPNIKPLAYFCSAAVALFYSALDTYALSGKVIGVALDGSGYGTDGLVWGGEVLVADLHGFTRVAHLAYSAMPGGDKAVYEPWRMAISHLISTFGDSWRSHAPQPLLMSVPANQITLVERMLKNKTHSPLTSSCGRLFDAVAALVCGRMFVSYEAQAAIELETCCDRRSNLGSYRFTISDDGCMEIETTTLFQGVTTDLQNRVAPGVISGRFHNGLIEVLAEVVLRTANRSGLERVCLSGGSFQNAILSEGLKKKLEAAGLIVFTHIQVPPGDGGLSLGQLAVAANQV
jgi:hydrogenase maturation protein HypF